MPSIKASELRANAGLLVVSLIMTACVLDVALRFIYPPPIRWTFPQEYYDFDAEIAHALRPNHQAYTHDKPVSVNSLGLRDGEYAAVSARFPFTNKIECQACVLAPKLLKKRKINRLL